MISSPPTFHFCHPSPNNESPPKSKEWVLFQGAGPLMDEHEALPVSGDTAFLLLPLPSRLTVFLPALTNDSPRVAGRYRRHLVLAITWTFGSPQGKCQTVHALLHKQKHTSRTGDVA